MSLMTPDWQPVRGINANHPTAKLYADTEHIYRIVHATGAILAPSLPSAGATGTLVRRRRLNPIERTAFIATNALSRAVGP